MAAQHPDLIGDASRALKQGRAELFKRAAEKIGAENVVMTDLLPEHVDGTANGTWAQPSVGTANSYTNIENATVASTRWLMFTGFSSTEAVAELELYRIQRGTAVAREYPVNTIRNFKNGTFWASDPVIVNENTNVTLQAAGRTTSTLVDFNIFGETAERMGVTINP